MIYVFEDNPNAITSEFFKQAYPKNISNNFRYVQGITKVYKEVVNILINTSEDIAVFMDTIPGNGDILAEYTKLSTLSINNNYRVIILPIVCSEFYLIQYLKEVNLITDQTGVAIALNKDFFGKSSLPQKHPKYKCNNFEHFCKIIVRENIKFCASLSTVNANGHYKLHYTQDCLCNVKDSNCSELDKVTKSIKFISEYPCAPSGSHSSNFNSLSIDEIWNIHRQLVDEFNQMVKHYIQADPLNSKKYQLINPIK